MSSARCRFWPMPFKTRDATTTKSSTTVATRTRRTFAGAGCSISYSRRRDRCFAGRALSPCAAGTMLIERADPMAIPSVFRVRLTERWQSGRLCSTGNAVYGKPYRGFESLPLRSTSSVVRDGRSFFIWCLFRSRLRGMNHVPPPLMIHLPSRPQGVEDYPGLSHGAIAGESGQAVIGAAFTRAGRVPWIAGPDSPRHPVASTRPSSRVRTGRP